MSSSACGCSKDLFFQYLFVRTSVHPSIAQVKIFVQGRISGTIDDRKFKKRLLTSNGEKNVSGLSTFE